MTPHLIEICHNVDSRFLPYDPGQTLTEVFSTWRLLPADSITPEEIADWAYRVFNVDLDHLEDSRTVLGGEGDFLLAAVYRLLGLRSLSTGDVIAVTGTGPTVWLACEFNGWRRIERPTNLIGEPLTADTIYRHIRRING
ncbi:hypothetical protein OHA21_00140 [Actinoplanes sp. NBC_00393]|uniref:hypothetical protein n=1 Tax=Actinoplanes sp. NBC_00393 TaxID=2975953 RepID=UPI002E24FDE6